MKHVAYNADALVMGISNHPKLQTYKTKRSLNTIDIHDLDVRYFDEIYESLKDKDILK